MADEKLRYLVWSNEHGAWWGPASNGYTVEQAHAGRYSQAKAEAIVVNAGSYGPGDEPNEVMVIAPEHAWHGRR